MITVKKIAFLLLLSAGSGYLTAQDLSFDLSISSAKNPEPILMKVSVSGSRVAMEPQNMGTQGQLTIVADNATGKQYMLMNSNGQKMAMAVNMMPDKAPAPVKEPKVTLTKETKMIDGHKCSKVITETDEQKADLWLTQDVGMQYSEFYKMFNTTKGPQGSMARIPELKDVKGFPVEIISTDKKKGETVTLKIKNISKAKVDPKLFSLEGYQMMDAGNINR